MPTLRKPNWWRKKNPERVVPCYVLLFDQVELGRQTLAGLAELGERLEIVAIENPSPNSAAMAEMVADFGKRGQVARYYRYRQNIVGNAYALTLHAELPLVRRHPYVVLTDGDLVADGPGWLDEAITVLDQNERVFACGVRLDLANLPIAAFPDAHRWVPPVIRDHRTHVEGLTGGHLLLFRGAELADFLDWRVAEGAPFVDGTFHRYCYQQIGKTWARTRHACARHLTWDLYQDVDHPYTKLKTAQTFAELWHRDDTSDWTLTDYRGRTGSSAGRVRT